MESLQHIKGRIKGIKNINQITKAMELVAATKMRRSQEVALASRAYSFAALELLSDLSRIDETVIEHPLLHAREKVIKKVYVMIASDKGLAGAFNSSVIRDFEKFVKANNIDLHDPMNSFVAVGTKAIGYLEKRTDRLVKTFTRVGDYTTLGETAPLANLLVDGYLKGNWDEVEIFSTHFRSALNQEVLRRKVLPIDVASLRATALEIIPETGRFSELRKNIETGGTGELEYLIEPSPKEILESLVTYLVVMQIYHLVLEANASEHAARRVAMKNASDNAEELAGELTVVYNKSRQAAITKEIIEIVAGAEAMQ